VREAIRGKRQRRNNRQICLFIKSSQQQYKNRFK